MLKTTAMHESPHQPAIRAAVLTVSDRCARSAAKDTAGPALANLGRESLRARVIATACVPDEVDRIAAQLRAWAGAMPYPDLILTTGGTGLAPRDHTPEATLSVLERRHPALLELARWRCYEKAPLACLSRGEAGTLHRSLIINFPGSRRGAVEMFGALLDVLPHAIETLRGHGGEWHEAMTPVHDDRLR